MKTVAFRYLAADQHPDHDTIAAFRQRHLQTLAGLFVQTLQVGQKAGLVKLGQVAIDGSKLPANASKHKAMSYGRMSEAEQKLQAEVEELLRRATRRPTQPRTRSTAKGSAARESGEEDPGSEGGTGGGSEAGSDRAEVRRRGQNC